MISKDNDDKKRITFGKRLRKIRVDANLTQAQVAANAGMHVNYYSRVERGDANPSYDILQRLMKVLKIKSLDLE